MKRRARTECLLELRANADGIRRMAHVDNRVAAFQREPRTGAFIGGRDHAVQVDQRFGQLRLLVAGVHRLVADDARRAGDEQGHLPIAQRRQRGARKRRRPGAVVARIVVGRDLARVFDGQRQYASGEEAHAQRALMHAQRAGRGRALERRLAGFEESLLAAGVELPVTLHAAAVRVDARQVVPDAQQVRAARVLHRLEHIAVGAVGEGGEVFAEGVLVEIDHAEQPVPVGAPAHHAGGAGLHRLARVPEVDHRFAAEQHARRHAADPGAVAAGAIAQRGEGPCAAGGACQALVAECQSFRREKGRRLRRDGGQSLDLGGDLARQRTEIPDVARQRRCHASQVRRAFRPETK